MVFVLCLYVSISNILTQSNYHSLEHRIIIFVSFLLWFIFFLRWFIFLLRWLIFLLRWLIFLVFVFRRSFLFHLLRFLGSLLERRLFYGGHITNVLRRLLLWRCWLLRWGWLRWLRLLWRLTTQILSYGSYLG